MSHTAGEQESTSIHYDDEAISALLDRSLDMGEGETDVGQQNILANDYLSSFKVHCIYMYMYMYACMYVHVCTCTVYTCMYDVHVHVCMGRDTSSGPYSNSDSFAGGVVCDERKSRRTRYRNHRNHQSMRHMTSIE